VIDVKMGGDQLHKELKDLETNFVNQRLVYTGEKIVNMRNPMC